MTVEAIKITSYTLVGYGTSGRPPFDMGNCFSVLGDDDYDEVEMSIESDLPQAIRGLTASSRYQSKNCHSLADDAAKIAEEMVTAYAEKQLASIGRECERLYKVQKVIVAAGLLDEDKFKEAYDIVTGI